MDVEDLGMRLEIGHKSYQGAPAPLGALIQRAGVVQCILAKIGLDAEVRAIKLKICPQHLQMVPNTRTIFEPSPF